MVREEGIVGSNSPASPTCRLFPLRPLTAISLLVVGALWALSTSSSIDFSRFLGALPPVAAAAIACALGIAALFALQARFGFCVIGPHARARAVRTAIAAALPFMAAVTAADLLLRFPADTHVGLPAALIFYPLIGLIAQLILHVVPFTLLLLALTRALAAWPLGRRLWLAVFLSASVEAAFQLNGPASPAGGLTLISAFVALQLLAFGVTELYLFRRYDFVTMYIFRLAYYGYWHGLWGNLLRPWS